MMMMMVENAFNSNNVFYYFTIKEYLGKTWVQGIEKNIREHFAWLF